MLQRNHFPVLIFFICLSISWKAPLPQSVDLSAYCPTAKWQYDATCYAYAFGYTALTMNYCIKHEITVPAEVNKHAFSDGFIASMHRKNTSFNWNCGRNGNYDIDKNIFEKYGCPKLITFRKDCTTSIPDSVILRAKETKLKEFHYIQEKQTNDQHAIVAIKEVLAKKIPVLIVLHITDDFAGLGRTCNQLLPVLKDDNKSDTAHDIVIIGYDDAPASKYFGRFLVKNNFKNFGDERNMAWVKYENMMYMITHALYFTIA